MRLLRQSVQYFWVALVGLFADFGTLLLLTEYFGISYLVAAVCGFFLGLVVNFLLSERFVFQGPKVTSGWARFALFGVIGVVGLAILVALMWFQVDILGWHYVLAKVGATVVVYAWNFLARRWMYTS